LAGAGISPEEVSRFVKQAAYMFIDFGYVNSLDQDATRAHRAMLDENVRPLLP
jgi:hypothetical protein